MSFSHTRTHRANTGFARSASGLIVPASMRRRADAPTAVDLFCGAGGFSLGLLQKGWRILAAMDKEPAALLTYWWNFCGNHAYTKIASKSPDLLQAFMDGIQEVREVTAAPLNKAGVDALNGRSIGGRDAQIHISSDPNGSRFKRSQYPPVPLLVIDDIRNWTWAEMREILAGLGAPTRVNGVIGGPPCQGFSAAGKRDVMDPRNSLVFEFGRMINEINPDVFVMENVPAMATMTTPWGEPVVDAFEKLVGDAGYYQQITALQALGPEPVRLGTKKRKRKRRRAASRSAARQLEMFPVEN